MSRWHPGTYIAAHLQAALSSLGRLVHQPVAGLMTITVIAITLALPTGLHLLLDSVKTLSGHWDGATSLSVFLRADIDENQGHQLTRRIIEWPAVESAQLLTPQQALTEFSLYSGFDEALDLLEENPLPMVVLIQPISSLANSGELEDLLTRLRTEQPVEQVLVDLEWVKRLAAMTEIARRGATFLSVLLGLAVLLIIGNTIRLEIRNRQEEIIVIKQVGGSDAFVRRPFLYSGFWYGLLGAFGAWLLILLAGYLLEEPVRTLAQLYNSDMILQLANPATLAVLLTAGPLLGLLGAWSATGRHLAAVDPGKAAH
jgi:cell division transport system permease protein